MLYSRSSKKNNVARVEWMRVRVGRGEAGEAMPGKKRQDEENGFYSKFNEKLMDDFKHVF